jgi:hypothetical protein
LLLQRRRQERHGLEFWLRRQDREDKVVGIYGAIHGAAAEQVLADEVEGETVGVSGEGHVHF